MANIVLFSMDSISRSLFICAFLSSRCDTNRFQSLLLLLLPMLFVHIVNVKFIRGTNLVEHNV